MKSNDSNTNKVAVEAASNISQIWARLFYCSHWLMDQRATDPKDWDKETATAMLKQLLTYSDKLIKFLNEVGTSNDLGALANLLMGMITEFQNFILTTPEEKSSDGEYSAPKNL